MKVSVVEKTHLFSLCEELRVRGIVHDGITQHQKHSAFILVYIGDLHSFYVLSNGLEVNREENHLIIVRCLSLINWFGEDLRVLLITDLLVKNRNAFLETLFLCLP